MKEYCCKTLAHCVEDRRIPIIYKEDIRMYILNGKSGGCYILDFCPWCGSKFPKNLCSELDNIIINELKLENIDILDISQTPGLPEEFKTDEWWKKRGL